MHGASCVNIRMWLRQALIIMSPMVIIMVPIGPIIWFDESVGNTMTNESANLLV